MLFRYSVGPGSFWKMSPLPYLFRVNFEVSNLRLHRKLCPRVVYPDKGQP